MALLSVSGLSKAYGADTIFSGVSFEVQEKNRIGLVGVNGSGKTTLFRLLTGEEKPDAGEIHRSKMLSVGYMEQHVCSDPQQSAYEEVLRVFRTSRNGTRTGRRHNAAQWKSCGPKCAD